MLKLDSISKTFAPGTSRQLKVLENLSIEVEQSDFVIILGSNGAGKSTLLRIIAGDLTPDEGKVILNGVEISKLSMHERAKYLYRINQSREKNLASVLTVAEVFLLALSNETPFFQVLRKKKEERQIKELLGSLKQGLENRINDQIWSLSGGEHQLVTVLVAAEVIRRNRQESSLLLLDEHVAHLDPKSSETVMTLTSKLVQKLGLTTLMVTHNMQIALQYGNRVLILRDNRIAFDRRYQAGEMRNAQELLKILS
jgi:putative ABC transport system ATP-binding protein